MLLTIVEQVKLYLVGSESFIGNNWKWAQYGNISKFLGSPFGLGLKVGDISKFLLYKVKKELAFWCSTHLSLAGRPFIVK